MSELSTPEKYQFGKHGPSHSKKHMSPTYFIINKQSPMTMSPSSQLL